MLQRKKDHQHRVDSVSVYCSRASWYLLVHDEVLEKGDCDSHGLCSDRG